MVGYTTSTGMSDKRIKRKDHIGVNCVTHKISRTWEPCCSSEIVCNHYPLEGIAEADIKGKTAERHKHKGIEHT